MLRDVYISVEALRQSMNLLVDYVAEWVGKNFDFAPHRSESENRERLQLWLAVGVDEETAGVLAWTLELHFEEGRLKISEEHAGNPELMDLVVTCLHSAGNFVKFTDSRFLTVGISARSVAVAMLLGVHSLVESIQADPVASLFYLNGFDRLTKSDPDRMRFVVESAFVSRASEGVMFGAPQGPSGRPSV